MLQRMWRAAKLDPALYEEVEHDSSANWQAFWVVVLYGVAAAVGAARGGPTHLVVGVVTAVGLWLLWAALTLFMGTKVLPGRETVANYGQVFRTMAFAAAPGLLLVFAIIPGLDFVVRLVVVVWMLAAMVVAVQAALDYREGGRAAVVVFVGWLVLAIVRLVLR